MLKSKPSFQQGLANIPILIGLVLIGVLIPVTKNLVEKEIKMPWARLDIPCKYCVGKKCKTGPSGCLSNLNDCSNDYDCGYTDPVATPTPDDRRPPRPTKTPKADPTPKPKCTKDGEYSKEKDCGQACWTSCDKKDDCWVCPAIPPTNTPVPTPVLPPPPCVDSYYGQKYCNFGCKPDGSSCNLPPEGSCGELNQRCCPSKEESVSCNRGLSPTTLDLQSCQCRPAESCNPSNALYRCTDIGELHKCMSYDGNIYSWQLIEDCRGQNNCHVFMNDDGAVDRGSCAVNLKDSCEKELETRCHPEYSYETQICLKNQAGLLFWEQGKFCEFGCEGDKCLYGDLNIPSCGVRSDGECSSYGPTPMQCSNSSEKLCSTGAIFYCCKKNKDECNYPSQNKCVSPVKAGTCRRVDDLLLLIDQVDCSAGCNPATGKCVPPPSALEAPMEHNCYCVNHCGIGCRTSEEPLGSPYVSCPQSCGETSTSFGCYHKGSLYDHNAIICPEDGSFDLKKCKNGNWFNLPCHLGYRCSKKTNSCSLESTREDRIVNDYIPPWIGDYELLFSTEFQKNPLMGLDAYRNFSANYNVNLPEYDYDQETLRQLAVIYSSFGPPLEIQNPKYIERFNDPILYELLTQTIFSTEDILNPEASDLEIVKRLPEIISQQFQYNSQLATIIEELRLRPIDPYLKDGASLIHIQILDAQQNLLKNKREILNQVYDFDNPNWSMGEVLKKNEGICGNFADYTGWDLSQLGIPSALGGVPRHAFVIYEDQSQGDIYIVDSTPGFGVTLPMEEYLETYWNQEQIKPILGEGGVGYEQPFPFGNPFSTNNY